MIYTKIPRKLKKRLKKLTLAGHSVDYIKFRKLKSKNLRIMNLRKDYSGSRWYRDYV